MRCWIPSDLHTKLLNQHLINLHRDFVQLLSLIARLIRDNDAEVIEEDVLASEVVHVPDFPVKKAAPAQVAAADSKAPASAQGTVKSEKAT